MSTTRKTTMAAKVATPAKNAPAMPSPAVGEKGAAVKAASPARSMNRQELVASVADDVDMPRAKAGQVVDAVFGAIEKALKDKSEVRLTGFGTFTVSTRKATTGRNPRTGAAIDIPESLQVRFKAGKGLKNGVA